MAIYHFDLKTICREQGRRSSVAASAYRCGVSLVDERTGITHDYSRRRGVEWCGLVGWNGSRSELWNAAEAKERRGDSRVAREIVLALPHELSAAERQALCLKFALKLRERWKVALDIAIHLPGKGLSNEGRTKNFHAHALFLTRTTDGENLGAKVRELDLSTKSAAEVAWARAEWQKSANDALAAAGLDARIDGRSLVARGESRVPRFHLGHEAAALERRGIETAAGAHNRVAEIATTQAAELVRLEAEETRLAIRLDERRQAELALASAAYREKVLARADELETAHWQAKIAHRPRATDFAHRHIVSAEAAERHAHALLTELEAEQVRHPLKALLARRLGLVPKPWRKLLAAVSEYQHKALSARAYAEQKLPDYEKRAVAQAAALDRVESQARKALDEFAAELPASIPEIRRAHLAEQQRQQQAEAAAKERKLLEEAEQQKRLNLEALKYRPPPVEPVRGRRPRPK